MCSGPFKLKSWKAGSSITLTRNDSYWNPSRKAHAATVNLKFITDSTALSQALSTGAVDGAYEVPTSAIPSLKASSNGTVYLGNGPLSYFMGWAHPDAPLNDTQLRKAIYIATDRTALADKVFNGAGADANTLVWKGTFDPEAIGQWTAGVKPYATTNAYNLAEAKKLVQQSTYKGQKLVMTIQAGDQTMSTVAQYIQQQAAQIGVKIAINPVQSVDYNTQTYDASARKNTDIMIGPSYNGYPDPIEGLGYVFEPKGVYNWTDYNNPKVLSLVNQARQTFDAKQRTDMLLEAQKIYEPSYPEVTLLSLYEVSYLSDKLSGMVTTTAYGRIPSLALIGAK
jgi:peptide/nickel transport system substrate-binding protein